MKNSEKEIIITKVGVEKEIATDYCYDDKRTDIDEVIAFLIDSKHTGATHIEFSGRAEYDNYSFLEEITITPVTVELESDVNFTRRLEKEKKDKEDSLFRRKKNDLR